MNTNIVIMAAGKGTRMNSELPKVLHPLCGYPMIQHVLTTADQLAPEEVFLVVGYRHELVREKVEAMTTRNIAPGFVVQYPQIGTGHAVLQTVPFLRDGGSTVVLNGDVPLIARRTIQTLMSACANRFLTLLTIEMEDPTGYGRIVRDGDGRILGIVEHKDCTPAQLKIKEVYTGIMAAPTADLKRWVQNLDNNNAQGEYYLTDVVKMAVEAGGQVMAVHPRHRIEVMGVNSPEQLAELEALLLETA